MHFDPFRHKLINSTDNTANWLAIRRNITEKLRMPRDEREEKKPPIEFHRHIVNRFTLILSIG